MHPHSSYTTPSQTHIGDMKVQMWASCCPAPSPLRQASAGCIEHVKQDMSLYLLWEFTSSEPQPPHPHLLTETSSPFSWRPEPGPYFLHFNRRGGLHSWSAGQMWQTQTTPIWRWISVSVLQPFCTIRHKTTSWPSMCRSLQHPLLNPVLSRLFPGLLHWC